MKGKKLTDAEINAFIEEYFALPPHLQGNTLFGQASQECKNQVLELLKSSNKLKELCRSATMLGYVCQSRDALSYHSKIPNWSEQAHFYAVKEITSAMFSDYLTKFENFGQQRLYDFNDIDPKPPYLSSFLLLEAFAFEQFLTQPQFNTLEISSNYLKGIKQSSDNTTLEQSRLGILESVDEEKPDFAFNHQLFYEYFVARFLVSWLKSTYNKEKSHHNFNMACTLFSEELTPGQKEHLPKGADFLQFFQKLIIEAKEENIFNFMKELISVRSYDKSLLDMLNQFDDHFDIQSSEIMQDTLTSEQIKSSRMINEINDDDETTNCQVISSYPNINNGFIAIRRSLLLQQQDELTSQVSREKLIELVGESLKKGNHLKLIKNIFENDLGMPIKVEELGKYTSDWIEMIKGNGQKQIHLNEHHLYFLSHRLQINFYTYVTSEDKKSFISHPDKEISAIEFSRKRQPKATVNLVLTPIKDKIYHIDSISLEPTEKNKYQIEQWERLDSDLLEASHAHMHSPSQIQLQPQPQSNLPSTPDLPILALSSSSSQVSLQPSTGSYK